MVEGKQKNKVLIFSFLFMYLILYIQVLSGNFTSLNVTYSLTNFHRISFEYTIPWFSKDFKKPQTYLLLFRRQVVISLNFFFQFFEVT